MESTTTRPSTLRKPTRPSLDIARAVIRDLRRKADEAAKTHPQSFEAPSPANSALQLRQWKARAENSNNVVVLAAFKLLRRSDIENYYLRPGRQGGPRDIYEQRRLLRAAGMET